MDSQFFFYRSQYVHKSVPWTVMARIVVYSVVLEFLKAYYAL